MNKNRIFAIFILFALLITCAGVSFASSDIDDYSMTDDFDDNSIDDDLEISDDDLDDEDWEDYDDEDDLDDEDWEDWDDEDWLYYYDNLDFLENGGYYPADYPYDGNDTNGTWKHYYVYKCGYATSSSYKYHKYNETDNATDDEDYNSTEEVYEIMYHDAMVLGASFMPTCMLGAASYAPAQNYDFPIETGDYDFNDYQSVGDEQNTSESNEKHDVSKNIELDNNSENNILALLLVLIVSFLMLL